MANERGSKARAGRVHFIMVCGVLGAAGIYACASDDERDEPDRPLLEPGTKPSSAKAAATPGEPPARDGESLDSPAGERPQVPEDEGLAVQDDCVASSCEASRVPPQPELPFLEDMGDGWVRLVEMDWNMAAGAEGYRCKTFTIPEDVFITAFAPQVPRGTHHVAFDISSVATGPDAVFACDVGSTLGERKLQGSGTGSDPNLLPDGVAMPLRAGEQLQMNLHLFNPNVEALHGRSGIWVKTVPEADVQQRAENLLVGPRTLDIPIGRSMHSGTCKVRADATVYGVSPHMHFTGVHTRASVMTEDGEITLHDGEFDPYETMYYGFDPVPLKEGDLLKVDCTFDNDTDTRLVWGDSALEEMCFMNFSIYPALPYGSGPCDW